jgi:hypothetical protein
VSILPRKVCADMLFNGRMKPMLAKTARGKRHITIRSTCQTDGRMGETDMCINVDIHMT